MRWMHLSRPIPAALLLFGAAGMLGLGFSCASARADDAACKGLASAMITNAKTPYHSIGTVTFETPAGGSEDTGGALTKSITTETIFTGKDVFVRLPNGQWQNIHASLDDLQGKVQQSAESFTDCQRLGDETAEGKSLAVYTGTSKSDQMDVQTKVWIAPDKGVLIKSETDMSGPSAPDGKIRHQHLALRYDYNDIKAPPGAQ